MNFYDLSLSFVMDLYMARKKATERNDKIALLSLQQAYPELFTEGFEDFVNKLMLSKQYIDNKYGNDDSDHINGHHDNGCLH
jgi:hypothetical protein